MKVSKIVAATDFSSASEIAVQQAAWIAAGNAASHFEIVHALPPGPPEALRQLLAGAGLDDAHWQGLAAQRLSEFVDRLLPAGPPAGQHIVHGKPAAALAAWAHATAADLLVLGAHGEHPLFDLFVGSTVHQLLRLSPVPVLRVKRPQPEHYRRVLIATDFSPAAEEAAAKVAELLPEAELHLLHVFEIPHERQLYYAGCEAETVEHYRALGEQAARQRMQRLIAGLPQPARYRGHVEPGYPPQRIKRRLAEDGAELLVVGAHRRSPLETLLLGSVAAHLVNEAASDLLLISSLAAAADR